MTSYEGNTTQREILEWILAHQKDTAAMDRINSMTYPFTTHYRNKFLAEVEESNED